MDVWLLNAVAYQDTYPLPHIDLCLDALQRATWFSTLDLRSGCAASVFQRLMDLVLSGLTYVSIIVFIDDIVVY